MPFMSGNCVIESVDELKNLPSKISKPENHAPLAMKHAPDQLVLSTHTKLITEIFLILDHPRLDKTPTSG